MLRRARQRLGFSGVMYAVVLVFAAAAVVLAIGTFDEGFEIAAEADRIDEELSPVNRDLEAVALAGDTARVADEIADEVAPLAELARREITVTESIELTAGSIAERVESIHARVETVHRGAESIHGEVASVNATVDGILGELDAILPVTRSIDRRVAAINSRVARALVPLRAIRHDLEHTRRQALAIDGHANAVNCAPLPVEDQHACHEPVTVRRR